MCVGENRRYDVIKENMCDGSFCKYRARCAASGEAVATWFLPKTTAHRRALRQHHNAAHRVNITEPGTTSISQRRALRQFTALQERAKNVTLTVERMLLDVVSG